MNQSQQINEVLGEAQRPPTQKVIRLANSISNQIMKKSWFDGLEGSDRNVVQHDLGGDLVDVISSALNKVK